MLNDKEDESDNGIRPRSLLFEKILSPPGGMDAVKVGESNGQGGDKIFSTTFPWNHLIRSMATVLCGFEPPRKQEIYTVQEVITTMYGVGSELTMYACVANKELKSICRKIFNTNLELLASTQRKRVGSFQQVSTFDIQYPPMRATLTLTYLEQLATSLGE